MTDTDLQILFDAFKLSDNDFVLKTKSFEIISDHNLFSVSFIINNNFFIYREKGEDKPISFSKTLDIKSFMEEIKLFNDTFK